jgi:hypothetical protein
MAWAPLIAQPPLRVPPAPPPARPFWRVLWSILAPFDEPQRDWGERTRHDAEPAGSGL